jgi:hypothetical protein
MRWLHHDLDPSQREQVEWNTLRVVGAVVHRPGLYVLLRTRHTDRPQVTGADFPRHHLRRRFRNRHACIGESKTPDRCRDCLNGFVRGDHADIVCNECDAVIRSFYGPSTLHCVPLLTADAPRTRPRCIAPAFPYPAAYADDPALNWRVKSDFSSVWRTILIISSSFTGMNGF